MSRSEPSYIFRGNDCNLLLYLRAKHVFQNFEGGGDYEVAPLVAGLLMSNPL